MLNKRGVTSPLLGVSKLEQLQDNIAALEFRLVRVFLLELLPVNAWLCHVFFFDAYNVTLFLICFP